MTQNNRIWVLMSRRLSGEATPAEWDELRELLEQSPDQQYLFGILHAYFSDPSTFTRSSEDADLEMKFRRIVGSADTSTAPVMSTAPEAAAVPEAPVRHLSIWRKLRYVASVAAVLFLIWGVYRIVSGLGSYSPVVRAIAHNEEVQAKAGARTRLVLPDGTLVWLNSNSKLRYNREFNSQNREVVLEGEAYFEVTKNAGVPFIVHAATLDIEVLGTSFTVKSYPQDTTVEATLLKGAIEVRRKGSLNTTQVILKPNEKIVFNTLSGLDLADPVPDQAPDNHPRDVAGMAVDHIRTDLPDSEKVETAWMYNRLVFDGENFQELAAKLERWYDVTIVLKDERLNRYRFSGSFASESIEEALKDLQLTADFTYKITGNEIELYAKK